MPFIIPPTVAGSTSITSGQIQDLLTKFHNQAFDPPTATIALPTRGVLGEAVLGHCCSAEKIDLTRFWNWSDAPSDTAPDISAVTMPTAQAQLATPSALLTGMTPLINNINTGPAAPGGDGGLLAAMVKAAADQKDFSPDLTGAAQLAKLVQNAQDTAEQARADALKTTKDLTAQAMATAGNIVGGIYGGNPTAGSDALRAISGGAAKPPPNKPSPKPSPKPNTPASNTPVPGTQTPPQPGSPGGSGGGTPGTPDPGSGGPGGEDPGPGISV
jgi:hypothetical protein